MAKRKQPNGDGGMKKNPYKRYPGGYEGTSISQIRPGWRPGDEYYGDLDDFNSRDSNEPLSPRPKRPNQYNANIESFSSPTIHHSMQSTARDNIANYTSRRNPTSNNNGYLLEKKLMPTSATIKRAIGESAKGGEESLKRRIGSRKKK